MAACMAKRIFSFGLVIFLLFSIQTIIIPSITAAPASAETTWAISNIPTDSISDQACPTVVIDKWDRAHFAWTDGRQGNGNYEIYYKNLDGKNWSEDERVSEGALISDRASIAVNSSGEVYFTWNDNRPTNAQWVIYERKLSGTVWGGETPISEPISAGINVAIYPSAAVDGNDNLFVTWFEGPVVSNWNRWGLFFRELHKSGTWEAVWPFTILGGISRFPTMTIDKSNNLFMAWSDNNDGNFEIYAKNTRDAKDIRITSNVGTSEFPEIAAGTDGKIHLVWDDYTYGSTVNSVPEIFYSCFNGTSWSSPIPLTLNDSCRSSNPSIAVDKNNNLYVSWYDYRSGNPAVYFRKHDGTGWGTEIKVAGMTEAPCPEECPKIAVDSKGKIYIVWFDDKDGNENREIYYATNAPAVSLATPASGPVGTSVTITGSNFVNGATVKFGTTPAAVSFVSSTELTATVPNIPAGAYDITVTNPDTSSDTLVNAFTVTTGTITVKTLRTNIDGTTSELPFADFSITGQTTYSGSTDASGNWTRLQAPTGSYTIAFLAKPGYDTPGGQVRTLTKDGILTFTATYELNDRTAPDTFEVYPASVNGDSVQFTWEAAVDPEPASGIAKYLLKISGMPPIDVGNTTSYTLVMEDGSYSAFVTAVDNVDNSRNSNAITFEVNACPPNASVTIAKDGNRQTFTQDRTSPPVAVSPGATIRLSASDENGIATSEIIVKDSTGNVILEVSSNGASTSSLQLNNTLREGQIYTITARAIDNGAAHRLTELTISMKIYSGKVEIINGDPFNYPNPFDPKIGTRIKYYLSSDSDTKIMIYNVNGKPVKTINCSTGTVGGLQDENIVPWDGKDNFGHLVANGPYLYLIVADGKVIGKGQMSALK
jgi:hypothetical protein